MADTKTPDQSKNDAFKRILRELSDLPASDRDSIVRSLVTFYEVKISP